jgi:ABC-type Fe3+ transport system permease subunit
LYLQQALVMLVSAYIIRFLAIGFNSIEAGFEKKYANDEMFSDAALASIFIILTNLSQKSPSSKIR